MERMPISMKKFLVAAFYTFTSINDESCDRLQISLTTIAKNNNILGSIIISQEGVNGTISGHENSVESLLNNLRKELAISGENFKVMDVKRSWSQKKAFRRFKARRKKEIVTMGIPNVNPQANVGTYVNPEDWNDLVDDPNTLIIDTRNHYEIGIGTFESSLDPSTENFQEFPSWAEKSLRSLVKAHDPKRIGIFCTGGIRCEKAS